MHRRTADPFRQDGAVIQPRNGGALNDCVIGDITPADAQFEDVSIHGAMSGFDMDGDYISGLRNSQEVVARGMGYFFDGVSGTEIAVPDNAILDMGLGDFTLVFRGSISETGVYSALVSKKQTGGATAGYLLYINSGNYLTGQFADGTDTYTLRADDTELIQDGAPHCVIFSVDRDNATNCFLMVDGKIVDATATGTLASIDSLDNANPFIVGNVDSAGTYEWLGNAYEALLFICKLSEDDAREITLRGVPYKYQKADAAERITNGGFAADTDWVKGTGWSIAAGVASCDGSQVAGTNLYQTDVVDANKAYLGIFTVSNRTAGEVRMSGNTGYPEMDWQNSNGTYYYEFVTTSITNGRLNITGDDDFIGDIDNVSVIPIGCVCQLLPKQIGHSQWIDVSGNDLNGAVSNAIAFGQPECHCEQYRQTVEMTNDTAWTDVVPPGYLFRKIIFYNSHANTATLDLGTTSGNNDVFDQKAVPAGYSVQNINDVYSKTASQSLYLNDDGAGTWNSATIVATLLMQKVT